METVNTGKTVQFEILRQDTENGSTRVEKFEVPYRPGMNVISALMHIQKYPVTKEGQKTTPVSWDMSCLEEVCGACSMVINGRPQQSCSALVDKLT
ncbi:MAG: 2Fe-2S iron-sulfur cluster-binding protein, partial [Lysinibacillus sp.]